MHTKTALIRIAAVLGSGVMCLSIVGYFVLRSLDPFAAMGQPDNGDGTYGPKPSHQCSAKIDGYGFSIELNLIHPFLAEYERIVVISAPDGNELTSEKFIDPGGLSSLYFFSDSQHITIVDGLGDGVAIKKIDGTTSRGRFSELLDRLDTESIGRTMFCQTGYQYLDATEVAKPAARE